MARYWAGQTSSSPACTTALQHGQHSAVLQEGLPRRAAGAGAQQPPVQQQAGKELLLQQRKSGRRSSDLHCRLQLCPLTREGGLGTSNPAMHHEVVIRRLCSAHTHTQRGSVATVGCRQQERTPAVAPKALPVIMTSRLMQVACGARRPEIGACTEHYSMKHWHLGCRRAAAVTA